MAWRASDSRALAKGSKVRDLCSSLRAGGGAKGRRAEPWKRFTVASPPGSLLRHCRRSRRRSAGGAGPDGPCESAGGARVSGLFQGRGERRAAPLRDLRQTLQPAGCAGGACWWLRGGLRLLRLWAFWWHAAAGPALRRTRAANCAAACAQAPRVVSASWAVWPSQHATEFRQPEQLAPQAPSPGWRWIRLLQRARDANRRAVERQSLAGIGMREGWHGDRESRVVREAPAGPLQQCGCTPHQWKQGRTSCSSRCEGRRRCIPQSPRGRAHAVQANSGPRRARRSSSVGRHLSDTIGETRPPASRRYDFKRPCPGSRRKQAARTPGYIIAHLTPPRPNVLSRPPAPPSLRAATAVFKAHRHPTHKFPARCPFLSKTGPSQADAPISAQGHSFAHGPRAFLIPEPITRRPSSWLSKSSADANLPPQLRRLTMGDTVPFSLRSGAGAMAVAA